MKNVFITIFCFLSFVLCSHLSAQAGNTYAVVIGVSKYQHSSIPHLKFADDDAIAFKKMLLSKSGGSVKPENIKCFINDSASFSKCWAAVRWMSNVAKAGDKVIFYFSGHGDAISSELVYLLTYDADGSGSGDYEGTSLNVRTLKSYIKLIRAKGINAVFITDAVGPMKLLNPISLVSTSIK